MKLVIVGWAVAASVFGLGGLALASTALADPDPAGPSGRWCPGQALPMSGYPPHPKVWQMDVCHDWYSIWNLNNETWSVVEGTPEFS
jgi:hypothetical protein